MLQQNLRVFVSVVVLVVVFIFIADYDDNDKKKENPSPFLPHSTAVLAVGSYIGSVLFLRKNTQAHYSGGLGYWYVRC